jgi:uncharacterized protein
MARTPRDSGEIGVRLQPRARRTEIVGEREGLLLARVTAPPVDGRANEALCKLIARSLGVAPGRVAVVRGAGSREKVVRVEGVSREKLEAALGVVSTDPKHR